MFPRQYLYPIFNLTKSISSTAEQNHVKTKHEVSRMYFSSALTWTSLCQNIVLGCYNEKLDKIMIKTILIKGKGYPEYSYISNIKNKRREAMRKNVKEIPV